MSCSHKDLVAYALDGLDEAEAARVDAAMDDRAREELEEIRSHLALHDQVEELRPMARIWKGIVDGIEAEPIRRTFFQRFWMPVAAAALVLLALLLQGRAPTPVPVERLHGTVEAAADGSYMARTVSRLLLGDGVTVTLDADTVIQPLSNQRLALKAGRVFLEVSTNRGGYTVEAGGLTVVTAGTAFLVERERVVVESGRVRCIWQGAQRVIRAGAEYSPSGKTGPAPREWFSRPTMTARILAPERIAVVIGNEMPDPIRLAPPTGGEPFFFVSFGGHDTPLQPTGFSQPLTLKPGTEETFTLRLSMPLPGREALFVSCPSLNLRVEAAR